MSNEATAAFRAALDRLADASTSEIVAMKARKAAVKAKQAAETKLAKQAAAVLGLADGDKLVGPYDTEYFFIGVVGGSIVPRYNYSANVHVRRRRADGTPGRKVFVIPASMLRLPGDEVSLRVLLQRAGEGGAE